MEPLLGHQGGLDAAVAAPLDDHHSTRPARASDAAADPVDDVGRHTAELQPSVADGPGDAEHGQGAEGVGIRPFRCEATAAVDCNPEAGGVAGRQEEEVEPQRPPHPRREPHHVVHEGGGAGRLDHGVVPEVPGEHAARATHANTAS